MPYPNEHAARLRAPGGFESIKRQNNKFGAGIHAVLGVIGGKSQLQAVRFDRAKFTVAQARRWLREHEHKPIMFEAAAGRSAGRYAMATWTTKYINDLPDSAFLYVEGGGKKDGGGKTTPRGLRHFPYKDSGGKVDAPHLRNAIARIPQSNAGGLSAAKKASLQEKARGMLTKLQGKKAASRIALFEQGEPVLGVSGEDKNANGQPVQRFRKDVIHVGHYKHPKDDWELKATPERMDNWVTAFKRMQQNGVDVEVVVDHSSKAKDVQGYVTDMFREGEGDEARLYAIHEVVGREAIDLTGRVKNVSVLIDRDFVDGKGNAYGEAITHSSLVQGPVVPGQAAFEPIAASLNAGGDERIPLLLLSQGDDAMDELLKTLAGMLGEETLTEEQALERVPKYAEGVKVAADTAATQQKELADKITALTNQVEELKAGGETKPPAVDEDTAEEMASTGEQRLSLLVEKGKITPAVQQKLAAALIGAPGTRNVMALSIKGQSDKRSMLSKVIDALQENDVVKLGEKTGMQMVAMSRDVPGGEEEVDKQNQKEMIEEAGG